MTVPTLLIVDDSALDRQLAGGLLERRLDCTLRYAADGKQALEEMARELPDLVLTDLQMPEMDGLELVAAVKKDYPLVPVVLMTAQGSEDISARALRLGAASYVPKRNLAADLAPTVERILVGSRADRSHSQLMHYLEGAQAVFVLPNDPDVLRSLVNHLQEMLRCLPLADETERLRVGVALEEALLNAYYHGNLEIGATIGSGSRQACERLASTRLAEAPYRDRRIRVSAKVSRNEAVFVIADEGPGFDRSRLVSDCFTDTALEAGRGLALMQSIMDEVVYNQAGNEVTLIKRRAPDSVEEPDGQEG